MKRVLVVADNDVVWTLWKALLTHRRPCVVMRATSDTEAVARCRAATFDVVVLQFGGGDIAEPIAATEAILAALPDARVIGVARMGGPAELERWRAAGAIVVRNPPGLRHPDVIAILEDDRPLRRIAIIDDNKLFIDGLIETLSLWAEQTDTNLSIEVGEDGRDAVRIAATGPDLLFIYDVMAQVPGSDAVADIRAADLETGRPRLPIVVVADHEFFVDPRIAAGADAVFTRLGYPDEWIELAASLAPTWAAR